MGLRRTLDSVRAQNSSACEWIVIDGLSSDGTMAVVREAMEDRQIGFSVRAVSEPDGGIYDAMNKGVSMASGEHCLFLNAGDCLHAEATLGLLDELSRGHADAVVYGAVALRFPAGGTILRPSNQPEYVLHSLPTYHQSILYPRDFIRIHKYDVSYRLSGDYYLTALAWKCGIKFVKRMETFSTFEVGGASLQAAPQVVREMARVQRQVLHMSRLSVGLSALRRVRNLVGVWVILRLRKRRLWHESGRSSANRQTEG